MCFTENHEVVEKKAQWHQYSHSVNKFLELKIGDSRAKCLLLFVQRVQLPIVVIAQ